MLFDYKFYLNKYPDLVKAGIRTERLARHHYNIHGKNEGRICTRPAVLVRPPASTTAFDYKFYLNKYLDLVKAGIQTEQQDY